jgi:hypothetical protein
MNTRTAFLFISFFAFGFVPASAYAFGASEKEQMREDVREALSRARDFNSQKVREATEDLEREHGAKEVKKQRAEFEAMQEEERQSFVKMRNSRPSEFLEQARLERQFDEEKLIEDLKMEKNRSNYVQLHRKVQRIINRRAYIDDSQEYGL